MAHNAQSTEKTHNTSTSRTSETANFLNLLKICNYNNFEAPRTPHIMHSRYHGTPSEQYQSTIQWPRSDYMYMFFAHTTHDVDRRRHKLIFSDLKIEQ